MAKKSPIIVFRDVTRDGVSFIEATATGHLKCSKKNGDSIEWSIINLTAAADLEVKVIDFYATDGKGGTPFAGGAGPAQKKVARNNKDVMAVINADGDEAVTYKYSVIARVDNGGGSFGPWFLVRDPELEIEPT